MAIFALFVVISSLAIQTQRVCSFEVTRDDFNQLVQKTELMEDRIAALEKENRELKDMCVTKDRLRGDRFVLDNMEMPVAFTAAIHPAYVDGINPKQTITFDTTITDIGGGYNNATGIFTAPRGGIYAFSSSLLDHHHDGVMIHAEIVKNNATVLGRVFAHAEQDQYRDQGAQTVVTRLNAGDQVQVRVFNSHNNSLGGQLYSTFTGFLLYADERGDL